MLKAAAVFSAALVALLGSVTTAPAISILAPTPIYSEAGGDGVGNLSCVSGLVACAGPIANITSPPVPPWQANNPGGSNAVWVSFDSSHGTVGPNVESPDVTDASRTVTFNYTFTLDTPALLSLSVWADDTAHISLDHVHLYNGNGVQDGACAAGPLGCEPGEQFSIVNLALGVGAHEIDFEVFQRVVIDGVGTPFGLMFAGELTPVPEPATILLLGSALTAAGMASRRRWLKKTETQS
jgi:hypothetical protein